MYYSRVAVQFQQPKTVPLPYYCTRTGTYEVVRIVLYLRIHFVRGISFRRCRRQLLFRCLNCKLDAAEAKPASQVALTVIVHLLSHHDQKGPLTVPCPFLVICYAQTLDASKSSQPSACKMSRTRSSSPVKITRQGGSFILMLTFFAFGSLLSPLHMRTYLNSTVVRQHKDTRVRSVAVHTHKHIDKTAEQKGRRSNSGRQVKTDALTSSVHPKTNFSGILARSFEPWKHPLPCFKPDPEFETTETPTKNGFLYVKPYKTGSSTTSGINLRIARNVALRQGKNYKRCKGESLVRAIGWSSWKTEH